jgi:hypothetical protein
MGLNLSAARKGVKPGAVYAPLNRNRYPRDQRDNGARRGVMAGYELVGLALLALFFGSLVSSKQSLSR